MDEDNLSKYNSVKNELDEIYDHIAGGTRIRSNVTGMNMAKNQKKIFELEKQRGSQNTIKKLAVDNIEITDQTHILERVREFYKTLFKTREQKTEI